MKIGGAEGGSEDGGVGGKRFGTSGARTLTGESGGDGGGGTLRL